MLYLFHELIRTVYSSYLYTCASIYEYIWTFLDLEVHTIIFWSYINKDSGYSRDRCSVVLRLKRGFMMGEKGIKICKGIKVVKRTGEEELWAKFMRKIKKIINWDKRKIFLGIIKKCCAHDTKINLYTKNKTKIKNLDQKNFLVVFGHTLVWLIKSNACLVRGIYINFKV